MSFSGNSLQEALAILGELLADRKLHYEVVAIGGGGLLLLGLLSRPTKDVDLVALVDHGYFVSAENLPIPLLDAIHEVGNALRLGKNWVNSGPTGLLKEGLPDGFVGRMETLHFGGLTVHLAGRFDQICFKLYAATDHDRNSKHFSDLESLKPTKEELQQAAKWCRTQDPSEGFAAMLSGSLAELGV